MSRDRRFQPAATGEELLSAIAEIAGNGGLDPSPVETGRRLLRRAAAAIGAAGGAAHIVDSRGKSVDVSEVGSRADVPAVAAAAVAHGEEAWLCTSREIGARFSGSAT